MVEGKEKEKAPASSLLSPTTPNYLGCRGFGAKGGQGKNPSHGGDKEEEREKSRCAAKGPQRAFLAQQTHCIDGPLPARLRHGFGYWQPFSPHNHTPPKPLNRGNAVITVTRLLQKKPHQVRRVRASDVGVCP